MTIHPLQEWLRSADPVLRTGRVRKIMPTFIEADGPCVPLGTLCHVQAQSGGSEAMLVAEVVRIDRNAVILVVLDGGAATFSGALVTARMQADTVPVGDGFLGRAVDAIGRPIDGLTAIHTAQYHPLQGRPVSPLDRRSPKEIFETGVRAIDGLNTLAHGQRVGVFAASGVGKTTLLAQIARQASADVVVLCLVGERGREVESFWQRELQPATRARSVLVAATSDQPAAMRVRAGSYALSLAEYWRDRGKHVVLFLDSITRLAMAMREIGLAAGEPPTVRAYTPGVFAMIPRLVERCGATNRGAISAIMTVLSESDDVDDPVCEMMKSLLDGHIVLSRPLAERGHYPAIDVPRSISRRASELVGDNHRREAAQILEWISSYETSRTLVDTGLYVKGGNPTLDKAIEQYQKICDFLKQDHRRHCPLASTRSELNLLAKGVA